MHNERLGCRSPGSGKAGGTHPGYSETRSRAFNSQPGVPPGMSTATKITIGTIALSLLFVILAVANLLTAGA